MYDLIAPQHKTLKPVGEYDTGRLYVNKSHVEQWLNGVKVVKYRTGSKKLNDLTSASKYKEQPEVCQSYQRPSDVSAPRTKI